MIRGNFYYVMLLLIGFFSCTDSRDVTLVSKSSNRYNYKDQFEISLPYKYFFSGSNIHAMDSSRMGKIIIPHEQLKSSLSSEKLFSVLKNNGTFHTSNGDYKVICPDCSVVKTGTITKGAYNWYYVVKKSSGNERPTHIFNYGMIDGKNVMLVRFYNDKVDEYVIGQHSDILGTIKFIR